jgi:hypothetical protein
MADALFSIELDTTAADAALASLPDALHALTMEACRLTAEAIVAEAQGRLKRQLSPAYTGDVEAGITTRVSYDGDGYVVLSDDERLPNLPLYLEKGTRPGQRKNFARTPAFPFFYASIELEVNAHERRITDAMQQAASQTGLGE